MNYFKIAIVVFIANLSFAQNDCNCRTELDFVIGYYERNLPGFKDNVTPKTKSYYNSLKATLLAKAGNASNKTACFKLLTYYVEFFKDNHSSIRMRFPTIDENDQNQLQIFFNSKIYQSRESYPIQEDDLAQYPLNDIRGVYQTKDSTYTIAVIPDKNSLRDYIGVIIDSKSKLWKKGHIKLEIKRKENTSGYEAFVYLRNHAMRFYNNYTFDNGILGGNWFKTSLANRINYALDIDNSFVFRKVNDTIAYLKIPTFSGGQNAKIDSLYAASFPIIRKTPYLIVDLRNNGGGNDGNAHPLLEFMYTNPIKGDKVDLYVTKDNIKMWERWYNDVKKDTKNYSKSDIDWFKRQVMIQKKAKLNSFIPRSKGSKMRRNYKANAVKKVVLLYNRNCGSSCETPLFWAMQSSKTILVGENSGGFVGYGEIGRVPTPCYGFSLGCTMTRYREHRKYEAEGIPPDYYLTNDNDWVEQTVQLLTKVRD